MLDVPVFRQTDTKLIWQLVADYPVSTVICGKEIHHIPLIQVNQYLLGHVARNNPLVGLAGETATAVFSAPPAYISPSLYQQKSIDGKVVPTSNYAVVHIQGPLGTLDRDQTLAVIQQQTARFEAEHGSDWKVSDAPSEYIDKMLNGIVGIRIDTKSVQSKFKLSQNRPVEDQQRIKTAHTELGRWMSVKDF